MAETQDQDQDQTPDQDQTMVYESALQLWAAAQTDFDPYQVPPEQWQDAVPVRDADIAVDVDLDVETVRGHLEALDGHRLVLGRDGGTVSVKRPIPEDTPL